MVVLLILFDTLQYVAEVIIDAPYSVADQLLDQYKVCNVNQGSRKQGLLPPSPLPQ